MTVGPVIAVAYGTQQVLKVRELEVPAVVPWLLQLWILRGTIIEVLILSRTGVATRPVHRLVKLQDDLQGRKHSPGPIVPVQPQY